LSLQALKNLVAAGKLPDQVKVWRAGFAEWQPLVTVLELSAAPAAAAEPGEDVQIVVDESPHVPGHTVLDAKPGEEFQIFVDEAPAPQPPPVSAAPAAAAPRGPESPVTAPIGRKSPVIAKPASAPPAPVSVPGIGPTVAVPPVALAMAAMAAPAASMPVPVAAAPVSGAPVAMVPAAVASAVTAPLTTAPLAAAPPVIAAPSAASPAAETSPVITAPTIAPPAMAVSTGAPPSPPGSPRSGGFLSFVQSTLPKPVLFGFYGAAGALLGVLLLGELVWFLLHPAPPVVEPLKVAVAPAVTVFPGTKNKLVVKIARQKFEGPVRVTAIQPPRELRIPDLTISAEENEAELPVSANDLAPPKTHDVKLRVVSVNDEKINVTEKVQITVAPTPPSLQVAVSPAVAVYAGYNNQFSVMLTRRLFTGPVRLEVLDLPKHVQIPLVTLPENATEARMDVTVGKDAVPSSHKLEVEVHSLEKHKIASREWLNLYIQPPPGRLRLAVSPQVTVFPGTRAKFTVKVARQEFTADIQLDVTDVPAGVQVPSIKIPASATEGEIEVIAEKSALKGTAPTKHTLRLTARALIAERMFVSQPFLLQIAPLPPTLQLAVSPKVSVYPGGAASFAVKVARQRFKGPVTVEVQNPPGGHVTIPPLTIPADKTTGEMKVTLNAAALALLAQQKKYSLPLAVTAKTAAGATATDKVLMEVLAPPSELGLTISPEVEVYQAGKCRFTVNVARTGFMGPVQVKFNNLPAGVTLDPGTVVDSQKGTVLNGQATIKTKPGKYKVEVTGTTAAPAPDGKTPTKTVKFDLIVKQFDPQRRPPLDIVFVLDVTDSMDAQIKGVRDGIGQFVQELKNKELEARIGLVAFRDVNYTDYTALERLTFKGSLFTTDIKLFSAEVSKLKAVGGGDEPESSLNGLKMAAEYPFRSNALKILLLITDALPQTRGNSVLMPKAVEVLKDLKIDQVHLIVKKAHLPTYQALQKNAKGGFFDLEEASKGVAGFTGLLPILSKEIVTTIGAAEAVSKAPPQPDSAPPPPPPPGEKAPDPPSETPPAAPRSEPPQAPKSGVVEALKVAAPVPPVAAAVTPPRADVPSLQGVQSTQTFADKDRFQLLIAIALWTATLAGGIALALIGGQKLYLQKAWLSFGEAGKAVAAGVVAGLVGGALGQWFFQSTSGSALWSVVSRLPAWAILGGLIGGGMGFFVPNLRWQRAFVGGCIGGLMGALAFASVSLFADAALGRWLGAALLGLCIGLMIGLAEVAFRRYWLEITFGEREVRTVNLGAAAVTLGGDEKLSRIHVSGAPARALAYRADRNRVFCEDFATGSAVEVSPGDQRQLASVRIKVCSAASARPVGANLQLVLARNLPLMEGMPVTSDDIPGLEPKGTDGIVALVSRRPNDPKVVLLRNRSKQAWTMTDAQGNRRTIEPGQGIELTSRCEIDFGQVKGALDLDEKSAGHPA
jgi:hypothetical protein